MLLHQWTSNLTNATSNQMNCILLAGHQTVPVWCLLQDIWHAVQPGCPQTRSCRWAPLPVSHLYAWQPRDGSPDGTCGRRAPAQLHVPVWPLSKTLWQIFPVAGGCLHDFFGFFVICFWGCLFSLIFSPFASWTTCLPLIGVLILSRVYCIILKSFTELGNFLNFRGVQYIRCALYINVYYYR